jgi:hypothetical protein
MMIIGFRRGALKLGGAIILMALLSPCVDSFVEQLPSWLLVILFLIFMLLMMRLLLGRGIADRLIAHFLYDLIRAPFLLIGWFLRGMKPRI